MPVRAKIPGLVRVPEGLWRDIVFGYPSFPGCATQAGHLGAGATTFNGAPARFSMPGSGNLPSPYTAYTVVARVGFDTPPTTSGTYLFGSDRRFATRNGWALFCTSGLVRYDESGSGTVTGVSVTASCATSGTMPVLAATRVASGLLTTGLYINGAAANIGASVSSWSAFSTLTLGWGGAETTTACSGALEDVYIFGRALTAAEVAMLGDALQAPEGGGGGGWDFGGWDSGGWDG